MVWKLLFLTVAVLMLGSCTANFKRNRRSERLTRDLIDIDSKEDDAEVEHNGSGNGVIDSDDEDLFEGSANDDDEDDIEISGSGLDKGFIGDDTTQPQSTRPFSECEQLRNSIKDPDYARRMKSFVPRCTLDGAFERLQCRGEPGIDECWCVFPNGNRVEGTTMHGPKTPDCQFGSTLKKCVYLLLKNSWGVLGTYRPRCTIDGEFEDIQCFEGDCWCVDNMGIERLYTRVHKSSTPVCQVGLGSTPGPELEPISKPSDVDVEIGGPDETEEEDDHSSNDLSAQSESEMKILTKPFVMGAVIAGAVVGLLGAILLVMFIVYRMRKKDEGSYALEEQKFTNYSYMKAPEKEFYA
ncbi:uncharacterized protein LOC110443492 isoform X3 [Mizuhopecten yessoensis]|uniref:uncharacterized protein LOC110443492 isoform X3 n=1 Tax=Mizuhopecten yessoensis TaxID=6573 RepID=UPI000B45740F|nr:uncharacterized protein LOC110443492 isoform X3 [Mizuhopecten yessoensis]